MNHAAPALPADLRRTQRQFLLAVEQIECHRPAVDQTMRRRRCSLVRSHDRRARV